MHGSSASVRACLLWLFILGIGITVWPSASRADTSDFVITDFTADYTLDPKIPGGGLEVVERIQVDFHDRNHGIFRVLPDAYQGRSTGLQVESITSETNAPAQFTVSDRAGNDVIRIGSPDSTVTGHQEYTIRYTERNAISFQPDHDELYLNVNGRKWPQPVLSVTARIHPPKGVPILKTRCLTGSLGSTAADCTATTSADGAVFQTTGRLEANQTLTVVLALPKGTFTKPPPNSEVTRAEPPSTGFDPWDLLALFLPPLLIGFWSYRRWRKDGKDPEEERIIPRSRPPEGLSVAEADVILKDALSHEGISATLVELAIRGYVRIHAADRPSFELIHDDIKGLRPHEQDLLCGLFERMQKGETVHVDDLSKREIYRTARAIQDSVPQRMTEAGYFQANPKQAGHGMKVGGAVLISAGVLAAFIGTPLSLCIGLGLLSAGMFLVVFGFLMPKRSAKGAALRDWLEGMKLHMKQEGWEPSGSEKAMPTARFERLLPYAMIFGLESALARAAGSLTDEPPAWFVGMWASDPYVLTNSIHSTMATLNTSLTPPSSGGSGSGFGGGGFSGGGFGGGGGGGW